MSNIKKKNIQKREQCGTQQSILDLLLSPVSPKGHPHSSHCSPKFPSPLWVLSSKISSCTLFSYLFATPFPFIPPYQSMPVSNYLSSQAQDSLLGMQQSNKTATALKEQSDWYTVLIQSDVEKIQVSMSCWWRRRDTSQCVF